MFVDSDDCYLYSDVLSAFGEIANKRNGINSKSIS